MDFVNDHLVGVRLHRQWLGSARILLMFKCFIVNQPVVRLINMTPVSQQCIQRMQMNCLLVLQRISPFVS